MELYQKRWQKARELMAQKGIDALLVTPSTDLAYMTGHTGQSMERIVCFALTQERAFFLMPSFEMDNLSEGLCQSVECIGWKDGEDPLAMLAALPGMKGRIAVGQRMYGVWLLGLQERIPGAQWVNGDVILSTLRRVKDAQELEYMFRAQHMAEAALEKLYAIGLEGKTEREVASLLSELRLAEGLESVRSGIVACSENAAAPHHVNGDRVIRKGDSVMMDFGGLYKGYSADMTRTCVVGKAPEGFEEIYAIVLKAHLAVAEAIRPGVPAEEIDRTARRIITDAGYGAYFTHRVGHGIGLDVHEDPYIVEGNKELLVPGNVFSDEPGIYLPGRFGIRIENLMVVTETGSKALNEMGLELRVVG